LAGEITLSDLPALDTAKLCDKPLRQAMTGVDGAVELVETLVANIHAFDQHAQHAQIAVLDLAGFNRSPSRRSERRIIPMNNVPPRNAEASSSSCSRNNLQLLKNLGAVKLFR
jgi:hypothetical protein